MAYTDRRSDGTQYIRLSKRAADEMLSATPAAALSDYLEQCDNRLIPSDTNLFLSAQDRLTRDDIVTTLPLCINIIRIGTTLVLPDGERFGRDDINASLSLRLVLALATLDEISRQQDGG
ncbi:MAG TPA: hypothetical protein VGC82_14000 [Rhodopila sp.]